MAIKTMLMAPGSNRARFFCLRENILAQWGGSAAVVVMLKADYRV